MPPHGVVFAEGQKKEQPGPSGVGESLSEGSTSRRKTTVDASMLRRALRLIHCMQKERGASCAYCSSVAHSNGIHVSTHSSCLQVEAARSDTNVAIRLFEQCSSVKKQSVPTSKALQRIRKLIDDSTNHDRDGGTGTGFHRILVMFNSVVSSFVHDFIVPHVKSSKASRRMRTNSIDRRSRTRQQRIQTPERFFVSPGVSQLGTSVPDQPPPTQQQQQPASDMRRVDSSPCFFRLSPPITTSGTTPPSPPTSIHAGMNTARRTTFGSIHMEDEEDGIESSSVAATPCPQTRMDSLLQLLGCFVRLKESTGVERATLSSILAMGRHSHPTRNELRVLKQRMSNDLVLEVENQRRIVQELGSMVCHSSLLNIMALVQPSVEYGSQMAALQQTILSDFDFVDFQQDMRTEEFWELITVYIDRLHSLELLIMEEIECLLEEESSITDEGNQKNGVKAVNEPENAKADMKPETLAQLFVQSSNVSSDGVYEVIHEMSPVQIKEKLLSILTQQQDQSKEKTVPDSGGSSLSASPSPSDQGEEQNDDEGLVGEGIALLDPSEEFDPAAASTKEWDINLYELQFHKRIGRGGAGTTYLANWSGQTVAVKVASINEMGLHGWKSEVQSLQRLHHPNIIRLLGSVYNRSPLTYCLVLEYCDAGDLESALRHPTCRNFFFHVATSIANGMAYLHSRGVIHRDIKPPNILLHGNVGDGNFIVKVTDFGVATTCEEGAERTAETGTYRWMAPEVIRHESYTNMADVYSFALLVWQLLTRESPFEDFSQIEAAGMVALEHARPPFPDGTPRDLRTLTEVCWSEGPDQRLPFDEISKKLREIQGCLTFSEKTWLEFPRGHPVYKKKEDKGEAMELAPILPPRVSRSRNNISAPPEAQLTTPDIMMTKAKSEKKSLRRIFSKKK